MRAQLLGCVLLFGTPRTVAHQTPLSTGFSRQEYWSGLPFPPPEDLPNPGIKPASLVSPALACGFFTTRPPGKSTSLEIDMFKSCINLLMFSLDPSMHTQVHKQCLDYFRIFTGPLKAWPYNWFSQDSPSLFLFPVSQMSLVVSSLGQ